MKKVNSLSDEDIEELYNRIVELRKEVIALVDSYGYSASQLVSRTFEHDVEAVYGKRKLKK